MAVRLNDRALLAGFADGQLRRALGTLGGVMIGRAVGYSAPGSPMLGQSLRDILLSTLRRGAAAAAAGPGGGEPEGPGIELQQSRRLGGGIAELEAQFEGGHCGEGRVSSR